MKTVDKKENQWVDLGLPSGNLWKSVNEDGYFTYNDAVEKFKDNLPTIVDFAELVQYCKWKWSKKLKGMVITGSNKNQITFPAAGFRSSDSGSLYVGEIGFCWSTFPLPSKSSEAYGMSFSARYVYPADIYYRGNLFSVRCVKHK